MFLGFYSCKPTPLNLSDDPQLYITESLYAMKGIIMRNVLFLALIGLSVLFTGCGVVKQVAIDTCTGNSYNKFICPGLLEEALHTVHASDMTSTPTCYAATTRTKDGVVKAMHTNQGPFCAKLKKETVRRAFDSKPGTTCTIEGKGMNQKVVCAGLNSPIALAFLILLALGKLFPRIRVLCGVIGFLIGIAICCNTAEACKNPKILTLMEKTREGTTIGGKKVTVQNPGTISVYVKACKLNTTSSLEELESQRLALIKAHAFIVYGYTMSNYCETLSGISNIDKCFKDEQAAESALNVLVAKAQKLYTDRWEQIQIEKRAAIKAAQEKETQELLEQANEQLEKSEKALDELKKLSDLVVQEGSCGGFLMVLIYGLLGLLGGCRSKLLLVLVALGCMVNVADAACTEKQIAVNKVTTQYGFLRYDCDEDEVSQASKDAVFEVIWRGYVAKDGLKLGMSKSYIRSRWERAEGAFWKVWSDAPLWQAKIAAAICTKEYLCGVTVKFSQWDSFRWQSPTNSNGTIDCGITQINSDSTSYSCDELQDLETAFKEQRRIIMLKVRNSASKSVWRKRIHRYNHKTNYKYGVKVWEWSGASFGCFSLLLGFLGGRRKVQGMVGPIAHGYHCPEPSCSRAIHEEVEVQDFQKYSYHAPDLKLWAISAFDNSRKEVVGKITVLTDRVVEVEKGKFETGCEVIVATMLDKDCGEVTSRITTVRSSNGQWVREGFKGYYKRTL